MVIEEYPTSSGLLAETTFPKGEGLNGSTLQCLMLHGLSVYA